MPHTNHRCTCAEWEKIAHFSKENIKHQIVINSIFPSRKMLNSHCAIVYSYQSSQRVYNGHISKPRSIDARRNIEPVRSSVNQSSDSQYNFHKGTWLFFNTISNLIDDWDLQIFMSMTHFGVNFKTEIFFPAISFFLMSSTQLKNENRWKKKQILK